MFLGLPLWWALGVSGFIVPVLAFFMLLALLDQDAVRAPSGFGVWLLFLLWVLVTATQIAGFREWFAFGYRLVFYASGAVIFLYVLNVPRDLLPSPRLVNVMAVFFAVIVVGGSLGVILPSFSFRTPMEALLPQRLLADQFVSDMVEASTTTGRTFAAYPIYRPKAPFLYTNQWSSLYALTLPFAIAALGTLPSRRWRYGLVVLLIVSVVPLVFSLGRGAWLSIGVAAIYTLLRFAHGRDARAVIALTISLLIVGAFILLTPLGELLLLRLQHGYGDQGRLGLYTEALNLVKEAPLFGYGAPVSNPGKPSVGTHGQLWTVIVSHGILGVSLFIGWFVWTLYLSGRRIRGASPPLRFWAHLVILVAMAQMAVYNLLPWGLPVVMVAAGLAWREVAPAPPSPARQQARGLHSRESTPQTGR